MVKIGSNIILNTLSPFYEGKLIDLFV